MELACVAFYGDRTVATDAFRMIEMSATGKKLKTPVLYNAEALKGVKVIKGVDIDLKDIKVKPANVHGDKYPNIDMILKNADEQEYIEHNINAEYLEEILNVLKRVDGTFKKVTLKIPKEKYKPIIITAENTKKGSEQKARALLMPMNR